MPDKSAKERLLDLVVDHYATDGLADQSLRHIAAAVGSSHRMLLYHFGSKDGLLVEVVRAVEARTRGQLSQIHSAAGDATDDAARKMWAYVADPALGDFERLFFALYGRALQGDESILPLLADTIESWLEANTALAVAHGVPAAIARPHARLGLAVTRGLLLDLLATGDRAEVDEAMEIFIRRYAGRWWESPPDATSTAVSADAS